MNVLGATTAAMPVLAGSLTVPLTIPVGIGTWSATFQAFALAPNEARLFAASPGIEVAFY